MGEYVQENDEVTIKEVEETLRKLQLGKAPGCDEIALEMLKYLSQRAIAAITNLYNLT